MKVRNGFVSNSSSSSFIILVDTKSAEGKENYLLFKFFLSSLKQYEDDHYLTHNYNNSIEQYVESMKYDLGEKTKDLAFSKEKLKFLKSSLDNKEAVALLDAWGRADKAAKDRSGKRHEKSITWERHSEESAQEYGYATSFVEDETKYLENYIHRTQKEIDQLNADIKKFSEIDAEKAVLAFEVSYQDPNHSLLKEIIESMSWIEVIERINR